MQQLVAAGLDHVQITLESHDPKIHDGMVGKGGAWQQTVAGIRNALDSPLYVMTNTTMLQHNSPVMGHTLDFLADLGVPTVGLNALIYSGNGATCGTGLEEAQLKPLLELARRYDRSQRAAPDLVYPNPILPFRSDGSGAGRQRLHRRALQHVYRARRRGDTLPILLPATRLPAERSLGEHLEPRPGA